ncbi:MAG: helix-turn-helix domain-containing protein [Clostridia bacterium]|nr:helix-turn-helix domain-containing protein [Clostridia bacterium]
MVFNQKKNPRDKFFPVPSAIFDLGLGSGEIIVYAYLMYCEDRRTYQCYPSYKTIGPAVGMSINTMRKYVQLLEKKCLIKTEWTMVNTKDGRAHNGSLKYTILPIQEAIDYYDQIQMQNLRAEASKIRAEQALKRYRKKAIIRTKTRRDANTKANKKNQI